MEIKSPSHAYAPSYQGIQRQRMQQTMRWFGPADPVGLSDIRQAGCTGVVTALHDIPNGACWPAAAIAARKADIEEAGLTWSVVESVPVHEHIKTRTPGFETYIEHYKTTLRNLAAAGIRTVTYNFMPVLDWTRTDLAFPLPDGAKALRFEMAAYVAFDCFLLRRPGAESCYPPDVLARAKARFDRMDATEKALLVRNMIAGLPGSEEHFDMDTLRERLAAYRTVDADALRRNLVHFLREIIPVASDCGISMALHPDDPPFPILGLPRVVSTAQDLAAIVSAVPDPANGICFCTGSFGVLPSNDLPAMVRQFGDRIHFIHLRNTRRNQWGDFLEDAHLQGDADMYAVVRELLEAIHHQGLPVPMRPDHGHQLLDDLRKHTNPGYSAIGRLRGLAEIRGLELGILRSLANQTQPD